MAVLVFCYMKRERLNLIWVAVIEAVNLWVYSYTDSRAGMMLCAVVPIVFYLLKFRKIDFRKSFIGWIQQWSFPICAIAIYLATMAYNGTGFLAKLDDWLSGRLYYTQNSMHEFGIKLFGQKIEWHGWGGFGHIRDKLDGNYNFVDTSYLKILLEYGLVILLLILVMWTATSIIAYRHRHRYLVWALSFLAIYSMVEQWLMNLGTNPFLLFLGFYVFRAIADITDRKKQKSLQANLIDES